MSIIYERNTILTNNFEDSAWSKLAELARSLKRRFTSRRRQLEADDLFRARVGAHLTHFSAQLDADSLRPIRDDRGRLRMQRWMAKTIEQIVDDTPHDHRDLRNTPRLSAAGRWEAVAAAAGWGELSGEVARIIANELGE